MHYRLSDRLEYIRTQLLPGLPVWDICCDHGLLGNAALNAHHPEVYFVDQVAHIIETVGQRLVGRAGAHTLCADATTMNEDVTGTAVIAGVGGNKIIEILSHLSDSNRLNARRLVLGPHRNGKDLLQFMIDLKVWSPAHTHYVKDEKREWMIAVFDRTL